MHRGGIRSIELIDGWEVAWGQLAVLQRVASRNGCIESDRVLLHLPQAATGKALTRKQSNKQRF